MGSIDDKQRVRRYGPERGPLAHRSGRLLVHELLACSARRLPNKPVIATDERTITYGEFDSLVTQMANGLIALGGRVGEVVGVQLPNTIEHVALTYALARAGMVCTPLNPRWTELEVSACMQDAGARFVVGDAHLRLDEIIDAGSEAPVELDLDETAPFHLRYTSGTTGKPKASLNTHRSLALFQMGTAVEFGVSEEEVHLAMASLTHAAIYFIHTVIYAGGTTVLKPAFDPNMIWEDCQRYRVTSTLVVPTILAMALDAPGEASTLRNVVSLGAPLATRLKERFADRFPHVGLHEMYGATELSMVTNLRPHDQLRKPRSVGQPRFGYALGIFDDDGNELPRGHVGTIYARGRSTHAGYVGAVLPDPPPPKLTAEGWVTVGDLGHIDDDGFLFISDRRSDLILSGGMNVYPSEVEDRLMRADGVREAAVVGLADDKWGRRVTACIVGSASAQDLDSWCRKHLANYKVPRSYVFLHELPKSPAGKVLRRELINQLESNIGRGGACGDSVSKKPR